jgi:hypothetical protein
MSTRVEVEALGAIVAYSTTSLESAVALTAQIPVKRGRARSAQNRAIRVAVTSETEAEVTGIPKICSNDTNDMQLHYISQQSVAGIFAAGALTGSKRLCVRTLEKV